MTSIMHPVYAIHTGVVNAQTSLVGATQALVARTIPQAKAEAKIALDAINGALLIQKPFMAPEMRVLLASAREDVTRGIQLLDTRIMPDVIVRTFAKADRALSTVDAIIQRNYPEFFPQPRPLPVIGIN